MALDEGRVALVVGDVAGHGVHAAAAMAQLRTALRAYLLEGHTPASALDRLDALVGTLLGEHTATALVAVVHPGTGGEDGAGAVVELASAGHPPPLLVGAAGTRALEVPPRPVLGVGFGPVTGLAAETVRVPLPPEAFLLLYSDGLVERRGRGLDETTATLARTAASAAADLLPAAADMSGVADRLLTAVPGGAGDDTTLVLLRLR
nr:PP2C family protein-serine/threonine phosphatase [Kineococcus vitellinus]